MDKHCLKKLKRIIRKDIKIIHSEYTEVLKMDNPQGEQRWLYDNYYLIEQEAKTVIRDLSMIQYATEDESGLPRCYSAFFRLINDGKMLSSDIIGQELLKYDFSVADIELIELMMRAAIISKAAEGIEGKTDLFSKAIILLDQIADIDFNEFFLLCSETEKILEQDETFEMSGDETKSFYRHKLAYQARKNKTSEKDYAVQLKKLSQKDGKSICSILLDNRNKNRKGIILLVCEIVLPLIVAIALSIYTKQYYLAVLLYFPLWEIFKVFPLGYFANNTTPKIIPKIKLENGIPDNAKTIVAVTTLLPSASNAKKVKNHLKDVYLTNKDKNIRVCLLADLKGSHSETMPEDKIDIEASKKIIDELNSVYDNAFMLLVRNRAYVKTQQNYSGYERKRGAIEELVKLIHKVPSDKSKGFSVKYGAVNDIESIKYILTLDSDTELTFECVNELISAALHPLNQPVYDSEKNIVTDGYGIFIPQVETTVESAYKTPFTRIMAGIGGVSSYDRVCGERYQDLFGNSIFTGKGLIDVNAYFNVLNDRFRDETVLSHDILEGEFLRTGYICSAQVTDNFPSSEISYFTRLHRWVRGDCQNGGFVRRKIKAKAGKQDNPLGFVSKFKIFDNIRRAITPVIAYLLILISVFMPYKVAVIVLLVAINGIAANEIYSFLFAVFHQRTKGISTQYYGDALPDTLLKFLRIFVQIITLPELAFACGDAIFKSIFRTIISKKNLLQWVTAADSDKMKSRSGMLMKSLPSVLSFIWLLIFFRLDSFIIGLFFLSDSVFTVITSYDTKNNHKNLDYLKKEKIKSYSSAMWNYYATYCNEENNFLPPDNVQETPVFRVANRTSPTNIGVMLCSVLAARDLSYITTKEMYGYLKRAFDSIIMMKKWHGNLLNWYSTKTLEPLTPAYVSTVDSGNFLCCLVALKEGIKEYKSEYPVLVEIEKRIEGIISSTDLSVFYSKKRKLFHIGFNLDENQLTNSYYDLLMSESRMTSYYAIAKKQVPKKHWGTLSRTLSSKNGYYGPVSWSGTMFEYFMPNMFVPSYRNTLTYEALRYCIYCQKLRTKKAEIPWGISESGYYKFDSSMNYQYKAHGVGSLALKKEPDDELVISPYSTFLCLPFASSAAYENLENLEKLAASGECGFYEAVDFSQSRCEEQDYVIVRSYMAHHVGMSLISIDNALFDNVMQKRFMRDDDMLSCKSILMEKINQSYIALEEEQRKTPPLRPDRKYEEEREFNTVSVVNPNVHILSNGEWTTVISDSGTGHGIYRMRNVTRHNADLLREPLGVLAFVKNKNEVLPGQRCASPFSNQEFRAEFDKNSARLYSKGAIFSLKTQVTVHPRISCELRKYTIRNRSHKDVNGKLCIYFEPSMDFYKNDVSHKAFSKLFISGEKDKESNIIVFERRSRREENSIYCACGFVSGDNFRCNLLREEVLERNSGVFSLNQNREIEVRNDGKVDTCAYVELDFRLIARTQKSYTFFTCSASSKDELYSKISLLHSESETAKDKCAVSPFGINDTALSVFPKLFYRTETSLNQKMALIENTENKNVLWKNGISGDNPIIYIESNIGKTNERIMEFIRINRKLRYCGIITDLIIAYYENEDNTGTHTLKKMIKEEFSPDLITSFGGVHLVRLDNIPESHKTFLIACANYVVSKAGDNFQLPSVKFCPSKVLVSPKADKKNGISGDSYKISNETKLPWNYVISNQQFGTIVSDNSLGFTFALNSHENKLTEWNNDTVYGNNSEQLFIRTGGKIYDVILSSVAYFGEEKARYEAVIDGIKITCIVTVPQKGMKKEVQVLFTNNNAENKQMEISYYCEPVFSNGYNEEKFIKPTVTANSIELHSPCSDPTVYSGTMNLSVDSDSMFFTMSKKNYIEGKWSETENIPFFDGCAAVGKRIILPGKRRSDIKFILSFARNTDAAKTIARLELPKRSIDNRIIIDTGNETLDNLFNKFLLNQIIDGRLYARSGFYQCGGAFGFRDQLQDSLSLILIYPEIARKQIVRCACAQFSEGDVLHWWHNAGRGKKGVRTRYSDDLLWLPYVLCEYVLRTGDYDFLETRVPFLSGEQLNEDENEKYSLYSFSDEKATLLEHARRAVDRALNFGEHSLLLMGGGDWNDGLNRVGANGKGESVWLSQFMCIVLENMAKILTDCENESLAEDYRKIAKELKSAIDSNAYSDGHYLRAFHDDGTVLGDSRNESCKIDSLAQSFAVFCDMPDYERKKSALKSAYDNLVDRQNGIVKLLTPAFTHNDKKMGYIASYPQGIRENGGQYTHAAVWLCMALFRMDMLKEGYEILNMLNPLEKYNDEVMAEKYKTEPYYLCGDVYSATGFEGRGGWSLYTGSASWYFGLVAEEILGLHQENGRLYIKPKLPEEIKGYKAQIIIDNAVINVTVKENYKGEMTVDGNSSDYIPIDGNSHIVNLQ